MERAGGAEGAESEAVIVRETVRPLVCCAAAMRRASLRRASAVACVGWLAFVLLALHESSCSSIGSFAGCEGAAPLRSHGFGSEIRVLEDLDGDGVREFVVIDPYVVYLGSRTGAVTTHAGRTLAVRARETGSDAVARFGPSRANAFERARPFVHGEELEPSREIWVDIADIGDFDGDGVPDTVLAISDPETVPALDCELRAVSAASGATLWSRTFEHHGRYVSHLQLCLVAWDDWNSDGVGDCLLGVSSFDDENARGSVLVIDSTTGRTLARVD